MKFALKRTAREWNQQSVCKGIGRSIQTTLLLLAAIAVLIAGLTGCAPHRRGPRRPPVKIDVSPDQTLAKTERVRRLVLDQLGAPYLYGGQTPGGFDCSGLVWHVFREVGVKLPRSARDQSRSGRSVSPEELRPGDLVFFSLDRDMISHVGVYVGDGAFVHAPGTGKFVRKDLMANAWWKSRLKACRRVLDPRRP